MSEIVNELTKKVMDALMESNAFKEGWDLSVLDNNGVIILRGAVPSKQYIELAESIAEKQEGVISVTNEMDVDASLPEDPDDLNFEEDIVLPPRRQRPYGKH